MVPTTISDAFLLALESLMRRTGQGRHLAASVIELDAPPAPGLLERAAETLGHRHPLLHAHVRRHFPTFLASWQLGETAAVPVSHHSRDIPDLAPLVARLLRESDIDILRPGPNLELHLATLPDGTAALILLWPHLLFDAVGIDLLLDELNLPDPTTHRSWGETANPPPPSRAWPAAKPMVEEMRTFPAWRIRSAHPRTRPGPPAFRVLHFTRGQTSAIREKMAATAGELLLLPYFAAAAARATKALIASRHPAEETAILLSLPVQRVGNPHKRPLFQNHMTPWSLLLTHEELTDLPGATKALYKKYASFLRRKLPAAMEALMALMHRCPSRLYLKPAGLFLKGEICSLFHSHTGSFPARARTLLGQRITRACHIPTVSAPPGLGIFFSEFDGQLTATLSWRENTLTPDEIDLVEKTLLTDLKPLITDP
ncbi:hypothetical protein [Haloferula sargassicola]|uniref:Condensation domain-containing protein n=1 Tax=Haloferula sargassicola TaxID=490096 RepID=A0ABP9UIA4_9BACT